MAVAGCSAFYLRDALSPCDHLTALTILATMATFLISICLRQMGRNRQRAARLYLLLCLVIAAATLFADFRYVRARRDACDTQRTLQLG